MRGRGGERERGEGGKEGRPYQPRKRTLVPGGWEGRLLRRMRVEGRGWLEEGIYYDI